MPKLLLIACGILISHSKAYSQTIFCPPNIDFEAGNFNNWELFTGQCCPITAVALAPTPVLNKHTITSGTAKDQYGNFPILAPAGGSYSVRVGNNNTKGEVDRVRYYVNVPLNSGKYVLLYRYAVVLEDPSHDAADQPRFMVSAFDSATSTPIPCAQYSYIASGLLPGFIPAKTGNNVFYKPWTTGTIDLSGFAGRTVGVEFTSTDCGLGAHFGYGYVDMNCGLYQIEAAFCNGDTTNITLNGPQGYQSYEWYNSSFSTLLANTQALTIRKPAANTKYAVVLTPYPGYGCKDTLYTTFTSAKISYIDAAATGDKDMCIGAKTTIQASATGPDAPYSYKWTPSTGLSCDFCEQPEVTGSYSGSYIVTATNFLGCSDTASVKIKIDSLVKVKLKVTQDTICQGDTIALENLFTTNPSNTVNTWRIPQPGTTIYGGNGYDSLIFKPSAPGSKLFVLNAQHYSPLRGTCIAVDSVWVETGEAYFAMLPLDDTLCTGEDKLLSITTNSTIPLNYNWVPSTFLSCNNCQNPLATPDKDISYTVYTTNGKGCFDTANITLYQDTSFSSELKKGKDTICGNEQLLIKNTFSNPYNIQNLWTVDTGQIIHLPTSDSIIVFWSTPGKKIITHKVIRDACSASDTLSVYVLPIPLAGFELQQYACLGDRVLLYPVKGADKYLWQIQEHNIPQTDYQESLNLSWNTVGRKKITLQTSDLLCTNTYEREILIENYPLAEIGNLSQSGYFCEGDKFQLNANKDEYYSYSWQPALSLVNNNAAEVTAIAQTSKFYTVQVINKWGCASYDSIFVHVKSCCDIFMPDAFTPNGDGHNERFLSPELNNHTIIKFLIANRRGQIVYEAENGPGPGWDGTFKGEVAGQDTYNYYLLYKCYKDGEEKTKKGTVILLR